ncbi:MAG: type II toxin-antitoxin system PemK/MazF family toxin [Chlorobium phaeobacteroides]|uniref:Transcriptional modulator of MazE/toxin, MazF n=1 Tax=Chlorobium phaeobacteroides (strain BS1) TaxID=331678 RepID=B3ENF7_CHLPB|nr:type II toxin-antitoxin system PemK/MazF family toxin [Chlorobium phaeobacteroides]NEX14926.1 type II toxin-antitoxin system PemK/MazF family toxin [Prosthecochloris sp.]
MKRGDLVTIALKGDYGKPRPALVIQSDFFSDHPSITVVPVTSELRQAPLFRIEVRPTSANGLKKMSQVMVDKVQSVPAEKVGQVFGHLEDATMVSVNRALALWLGFA